MFLQVLFGCIYPDMCIAYSFGIVWLHFSGHVYCIHFGFDPANNLVCTKRINRTTFHMSVTWKFNKVIFQKIFYSSIKVLISFAWLDFT
jgi:hypothetical protein